VRVLVKKYIKLIISSILVCVGLSGCSNKVIEANGVTLEKQKKTQHFIFYSNDKDAECLEDLSKELESNFKVITSKLKVNIKDDINVLVYPDIESFHIAMNDANASDSVVGTGWGREIKIVSPLNPGTVHKYDSVKKILVHEFNHVVISNINSNLNEIPAWLNEGIATYEAKQMSDKIKAFIKQKVSENKIPTFVELTKGLSNPDGSHIFSYTIVEFLVYNFGYDKIIDILKSPENIEKVLRISIFEFEKQWITYMKENY
jgi:hypothetical protein